VEANLRPCTIVNAGAIGNAPTNADVRVRSWWKFEAFNSDGNPLWVENVPNTVVDAGINDLLDKYFKGSTYTAAWYIGLKNTGTVDPGDTLASHSGWTENTSYTGNRQALTLGTVSGKSVNNSANKGVFPINGTTTIYGGFICNAQTGTSGILYFAADFSAPRSLGNGDTLNVTITLSGS
jgi:hypothetical protein